ncbi:MAG: ATP-binding protein [Desulfobulbaceae bacterium]|nr:ATP-binding protein [Desulfobulbaceae bacterium]HIJ79823.1 hypothetical protein [Deltaproteobacteria bacterium]
MLVLLFLGIALGVSYLLTRDVVRPLQDLILKLKINDDTNTSKDDISILDDTFSNLVDNLGQAFQTIQEFKDSLEDKVKIRTRELEHTLNELRDTQMQLVQSEKMSALGQLVAGVAHEINNTINFVSGALPPLTNRLNELKGLLAAESKTASTSTVEDYGRIMKSVDVLLDNIWEGARRTIKIVNDLKNFSRPDEEVWKPVAINDCLDSTLNLAYHEYKHRLEIVRDFAPELSNVNGSQSQLNQVFMNILINAIHAQPDGGMIKIKTWEARDKVHILFSDKGTGIPENMLGKIFDPFFTTKEFGKGSGLGLSISYGIIINHKGEIMARNLQGGGCEFEIILPVL